MTYNILRKIMKNWFKAIILGIVIWQWNFSYFHYAQAYFKREIAIADAHPDMVKDYKEKMAKKIAQEKEIASKRKVAITAYSSTIDQTDSTPCITANGFDLCENNLENVIAANFLPFGTRVRIPKHFGDQIFIVQDRMNARYYYRADIWMQTRQKAKEFGIKYSEIEILK